LGALEIARSDRVLEIGFGHGRTVALAAAAAAGVVVDGVDVSEDMVRVATRRCRKLVTEGRVRLRLGDVGSLPYADGSFDKVFSVHTLYFWADPAAALDEVRRVLRASGTFVLGFRGWSEEAVASFPPPTYRFYRLEEVRGLLASAGFSAVTVNEVGGG